MPVDLVRDAAIDVLLRVFDQGMYLDRSLDKTLSRKSLGDRGRRFMTQLVYGTVRHRALCDHALRKICHVPLEDLPTPILAVLRMGVFQALFCHQVTFPSMVHTAVDLAKRRGHAGTARLVNAVLRKAPTALDTVRFPSPDVDALAYLSVRYSVPEWLARLLLDELGRETAEAALAVWNTEAPVTLRVNTMKTTPEQLIERLQGSGVLAEKRTAVPEEITVLAGGAPLRGKWFQQGHFMVQDPASMLPPRLLDPQPGESVLDLCAAPGGKSTHLAQLMGGQGRVLALDSGFYRLRPLLENKARLEMPSIQAVCGDGTAPPLAAGFDRVLVDAPCSGLGTIRRHPDLKWHLEPQCFARLAEQQRALLRSGIDLCKPGGVVVYSVCTFTRQETVENVEAVLADGQAQLEDGPEQFSAWKMNTGQYRTPPDGEALDSFFLTRFRKRS